MACIEQTHLVFVVCSCTPTYSSKDRRRAGEIWNYSKCQFSLQNFGLLFILHFYFFFFRPRRNAQPLPHGIVVCRHLFCIYKHNQNLLSCPIIFSYFYPASGSRQTMKTALMVAEKPSLALALAKILSDNKTISRKGMFWLVKLSHLFAYKLGGS